MREEYTEYKGRKNHNNKKNTSYIKKLIRQTIFSIVIFTMVISPEILGMEFGNKIKSVAKSALFYTIDTKIVTEAFKNIYPRKGEHKNDKENTSAKNI